MSKEVCDCLLTLILDQWSYDQSTNQVYTTQTGWISRGRMEEETRGAANGMYRFGISAGDRVLIFPDRSLEFIRIYLATLRLGAVAVMANPDYTDPEITHLVALSKPTAFWTRSDAKAAFLFELGQTGVHLGGFSGPGSHLNPTEGMLRRIDDSPSASGDAPLDFSQSSDSALVFFTSGTTGKPKGVLMSHGSLGSNIKALQEVWEWQEGDELLLTLPLFHMHGLGVGINGTLALGSRAVILERFEPSLVASAAASQEVSMFFGVPTMYARLLDSGDITSLSGLRLLVSGSAPMGIELHERLRATLGDFVVERYGMSEAAMISSNPFNGIRIPKSVGRALPHIELDVDPDSSEILVKGPNLFDGYLGDIGSTEASFDHHGRFRTGDSGVLDDSGYLYISGRLKDLIITGGFNVYPREVEDVLSKHPGVRDVAVVGFPSDHWGEEVVAFVVADDVSEKELSEVCAKQLVGYKRPKRILFLDSIPKNSMGKTLYKDLKTGLS